MSSNALQWTNLMMQRMQSAAVVEHLKMQHYLMQTQEEANDDDNECSEELRTLFIANLDDTKVDEELLYELFLHAGPIEKVSFPKKKSFAFITYVHRSTPAYAMHLYQGLKLFHQPLVIKFKGTTNLPPLFDRILPPSYGFAVQPRNEESWVNPFAASAQPNEPLQRSFDNSALRSSRYAGFMEDDRHSRRDRSPQSYSRHRSSRDDHSRRERTKDRDNDKAWTHGPDRNRSRSNHGSHPYDRRRF